MPKPKHSELFTLFCSDMLIVDINQDGIIINDNFLSFPISIQKLKKLLGSPALNKTFFVPRYLWNQWGIYGFSENKKDIDSLVFLLEKPTTQDEPLPETIFKGKLTIKKIDYNKIKFDKAHGSSEFIEMYVSNIYLFGFKGRKKIHSLEVRKLSVEEIAERNEFVKEIAPDKYLIKETKGDNIIFHDFNFKLAVIEELMYQKEALKPKFNINEYAKWYSKKKINLNQDRIIPEAREYFMEFAIEKEMANLVSRIDQTNMEIYQMVYPMWDGEDDLFNIKSIKGLEQFKNLQEVNLYADTDSKVIELFKKAGIRVKIAWE